MLTADKIPHLKVYRQRVFLPRKGNDKTYGCMILINNKDYKGFENLLNHNLFYNQSSFLNYYVEYMFKLKVAGKSFNQLLRNERHPIYDFIDKSTEKRIKTPDFLPTIQGRNVFYDLFFYNNLFYSKSMILSPVKRAKEWVPYYKSILDDKRLNPYQKTMFIDMDQWIDNVTERKMDNPITIINYLLWKEIDLFKSLGDIDLYFYTKTMVLRVNPKLCNKYTYREFRRELAKMNRSLERILVEDENLEQLSLNNKITNSVVKGVLKSYNFVGQRLEDDSIEKLIIAQAEKELKLAGGITEDEEENKKVTDNIIKRISSNDSLNKKIFSKIQQAQTGRVTLNNKRDLELREKQKEIKIDNMSFEDLQKITREDIVIDTNDVSEKVYTMNKNLTTVKFANFDTSYDKKMYRKDVVNVFSDLNNKSLPVYVRKVEIIDASDEFNYKETWRVELEDSNRKRHLIKVDMPKFVEGTYLYLNGNKSKILNQLFNKPIVKNGPDTCQICTNYNKIFIRREGTRLTKELEGLKKYLLSQNTINYKQGNSVASNNLFSTTIEYDELSKTFISIKSGDKEFIFNQEIVQEELKNKNIKLKNSQLCIGFEKGTPIILDMNNDMSVTEYIISSFPENIQKDIKTSVGGKRFVITSATIMSKKVPLIFLMGYFEGINTVLRKAKIQHRFSDSKPTDVSENEGVIRFKDCYLVYNKKPIQNTFLMNAFSSVETMAYEYNDFESKDVYINIFENIYGRKNVALAFNTYYDCMVDPITREVLEKLNYPTDLVSMMIFCNDLLADNTFIKENNMNMYRIRSNEVAASILYKEISNAYGKYVNSASNNTKISIPQDQVIKTLGQLQTVEPHSTLNPIYELEKRHAITPKGYVGLNMDKAYDLTKRSYDPTMMGILAMSSSPDYNVGKVRALSMEPNIINSRGFIDIKNDKPEEIKDVNIFSPAEMLTPLSARMDDTIRASMATKQSKHIIPNKNSSPVLISNGAEQVIQYHLGDDFVITAKDNGEVVERNDKLKLLVVKYNNGEHKAINLGAKVVKNGAGGFFLSNTFECKLKEGDKFNKNDILASDDRFFTNDNYGNRFNLGVFTKVACFSSYCTFEDSCPITESLAERISTELVTEKEVILGPNVNIGKIVKKGDTVQVNDTLIEFEESFEEDSINALLASIGEEMQEEIKSLGKQAVKSKYKAVIEDIRIIAGCDVDEMSPSLAKVCNNYYNEVNKKKKMLNKYDDSSDTVKCGMLFNETSGKVDSKHGKIVGKDINGGVLIRFYLKFKNDAGVGDKLVAQGALKAIISEVVPKGQEMFAISRPEEPIDFMFSGNSLLKRMVPSLLVTMFANKTLVELKRKLKDIYNS